MAITKVSELGDTIPTLIEEAHFIEQFKAVMRGLSWTIPKRNGSTINVPYFSEVTANVLTEGVDMTGSETMEDTKNTKRYSMVSKSTDKDFKIKITQTNCAN